MSGIIGRKLGMTQIFDESGAVVPVTVIEAGPCPVVQVRTDEKDGYAAVQLGFGAKKATRATSAEKGHATKAGLEAAPAVLKEFRFDAAPALGESVTVDGFERGLRVKVTGVTKGRGFQGVMKRHGFGGGRASHGATRVHRAPGSIGAGTNPSRVIKGKRMPGHMGDAQQTVRNLLVAKVDAERNLLYVRGAVPGPVNGYVFVTRQ
ncbi:50S ribosomal protein L3 [Longimicrobium terrae]|jgi:large subunit ribosomal protein L3|uniref:Large ribosomal subunit protein uL3 n=1 Tax=Longimicrobium terrae TaxID=1639882 RepID=A0A841GP30_9BACT|nr:50S ribosomal protein L3 [Longimicrobium terrae]MBB4634450.1 large subunit ribosomal protein L3 [Longimicrobium terrae]MBB6068660.1 large subunit ribosomal protein L3 [Longimicrobium terrae]NNC27846.1 50S ribosomal protein L3 [Longimicrobium terrae]